MIRVTLKFVRATTNAYKFDATEPGPIQTLYVHKSAFTKQPAGINVTIDGSFTK